MSDRELVITVEDGYLKAYAKRIRDGQQSGIQYGLQGRERDEVQDAVRQLVEEFLADEIPAGGLWRKLSEARP